MFLTGKGLDNRHMCCVRLKLASYRPHIVAPLTLAADVMPRPCVFRSLVLSRITPMVESPIFTQQYQQ